MLLGPIPPITPLQRLQGNQNDLDPAQFTRLRRLQARDQRVRAHEQAHNLAGGGQVAPAVRYHYQTGPDGRRYAVGGQAHTPAGGGGSTAEQALDQSASLRRAAVAPTRPSYQDRITLNTAFVQEERLRNQMKQAEEIQQLQQKVHQAQQAADSGTTAPAPSAAPSSAAVPAVISLMV